MYSTEDLVNEINAVINSMAGNGLISARWVTQAVISNHEVEDGHAKLCQQQHTRAVVGKCMAQAEKKHARQRNEEQLEFMGSTFNYVQDAYVITRDGDDVMVSSNRVRRILASNGGYCLSVSVFEEERSEARLQL